jgi:alcohol dehydrogenase
MPDLPTKMPRIPGGDIAGIVREAGEGVPPDWIGKRVVRFPRIPAIVKATELARDRLKST